MSSTIDPRDVQILFADLQPQLISASQTVSPDRLASAAEVLVKVAGILELPTTYTVVPVAGQPGILIPQLARYATPASTFARVVASPFLDPAIAARLASHNRNVLVIAGFSAEVVVFQSSLDGIMAGYSVQVPLDAIGSRSERTESPAIRQIERAGGAITSVLSLVTRMSQDFSREPGALILKELSVLR